MADTTTDRFAGVPVSRRGAVTVAVVAAMAVGSHLVAPIVAPEYAVYARYATYLVAFSAWMAWFVDWLAVWLGQEAHPSEVRDGEGDGAVATEGRQDDR